MEKYGGTGDKADLDNHANQFNPDNPNPNHNPDNPDNPNPNHNPDNPNPNHNDACEIL